jgi:hypothetical protein
MKCDVCSGKGWRMWVYPARKPRHVMWFQRGPHGERPHPCPECDGSGVTHCCRGDQPNTYDAQEADA